MFEKDAEEYRESKRHKSFRADVGTVQINYESYLNNLQSAFKEGAEFGYDKGFKEGLKQKVNITTISDCPIKDEWHDLQENPEDLPDESSEIIKTYGDKVYAKCKDNHYYLIDRVGLKNYDDVIAWCELPVFDR